MKSGSCGLQNGNWWIFFHMSMLACKQRKFKVITLRTEFNVEVAHSLPQSYQSRGNTVHSSHAPFSPHQLLFEDSLGKTGYLQVALLHFWPIRTENSRMTCQTHSPWHHIIKLFWLARLQAFSICIQCECINGRPEKQWRPIWSLTWYINLTYWLMTV